MIKKDINFSHPYIDIVHGLLSNIDTKSYYIAGGSIMKLTNGMDLGESDIDVFFKNAMDFRKATSILPVSSNVSFVSSSDYAYSYEYFDYQGAIVKTFKIQLIHERFAQSVEELLNSFDINICKYAIHDFELYMMEEAVDDFNNKRIRISDSRKANNTSLERIGKYISLGFKADKEVLELITRKALENNSLVFVNSRQQSYFLRVLKATAKMKLKSKVFHDNLKWGTANDA